MTEMLMRGAKKLGAYFNGKNKKRVGQNTFISSRCQLGCCCGDVKRGPCKKTWKEN
jgi:hypothetical protein